MQIIREISNIKTHFDNGCVLTIGNFDGVHLGHQELIRKVVAEANILNVPSAVLIFEPHPQEFFYSENLCPARLSTLEDKLALLAKTSIDCVVIESFNEVFAKLKAQYFVKSILVEEFKIEKIVLGHDFRFGYKREGDFLLLEIMGNQHDFEALQMEAFLQNNQAVSSSLVRRLVEDNNFSEVKKMLGRDYSMYGTVIQRQQKGPALGYKAANIETKRKKQPLNGVYAVTIKGLKHVYNGVASIGQKAMSPTEKDLLEVHIFDFEQDITGQSIEVIFHKKCRDILAFSSGQELKEQIAKDIQETQIFFANQ